MDKPAATCLSASWETTFLQGQVGCWLMATCVGGGHQVQTIFFMRKGRQDGTGAQGKCIDLARGDVLKYGEDEMSHSSCVLAFVQPLVM